MTRTRLVIGCGYLGRRVARRWLAEGGAVHALTRSPERAEDLRRAGIAPHVGDVTNPASLGDLPEVDTLLYAVGLDRSTGQSQRDVSVGGLANVLPRVAGRVRRAIYISSTSVYGQDGGEWVDESSECRPESDNGKVCLEAEGVFRVAFPAGNILRLAGIYGPGRLVARIEALRAGKALEGNPDAWLNLIHVDDAVAAVLACERRGADGATYVVADNKPCPRREYYSVLAAMIGAPPPSPPLARGGQEGSRGEHPRDQIETEARQGEGESGRQGDSARGALNKRCSNRRMRDELQVVLRFPNMRIGLPDALSRR
ncbi:MAG: SDR family oxidoreductase [Planctomycetia bacterium]|nr:SDR family oxidoreductase [Planctomycetia bacterium]